MRVNANLKPSMLVAVALAAGCAKHSSVQLQAPRAQPAKPRPKRADVAPLSPATQLAVRCTEARCDFDLTRSYASFDQPHEVLVDPCRRRNMACSIHGGWLTAAGRNAFASLRDELQISALADVYGCPGCADGPTYGVILPGAQGLAPALHRYDPMHWEELPAVLRRAHALFERVRQSVQDCVADELVEIVGSCEPVTF